LFLHRIVHCGGPSHGIQTPALGVIAQGSKRIMVGDELYVYDPMHYLVSSVDLPVMGQVTRTRRISACGLTSMSRKSPN